MAQTIYLSTFGSFGDVYPFVALSVALKARGGRPIVFINPSFSDLFETHGIEAHAVGAPIDVDALLRDSPKYLHPRNGTRYAMEDLFAPFSAQTLAAASALAETTPRASVSRTTSGLGPRGSLGGSGSPPRSSISHRRRCCRASIPRSSVPAECLPGRVGWS